jgi:hypothetical protein
MLLSSFSETALAALELQASTYETSGATFIEFLSLLTGSKKILRLVVTADKLREVETSMVLAGLQVSVSPQELVTTQGNINGDRFQEWAEPMGRLPRALYISKDRQISELAAKLDMQGDDASFAQLLGYPSCCHDAYDPNRYQNWWFTISYATKNKAGLSSMMNRISRLYSHASFLYDYFPCSLDCTASKLLADSNRSILLGHGCNELVSRWDLLQSGQFLVFPDCVMKHTENGWQSIFGLASKQDYRTAIELEFSLK